MVKTDEFTTKGKDDRLIAVIQQIQYDFCRTPPRMSSMPLSAKLWKIDGCESLDTSAVAKMAIYSSLQPHFALNNDFPRLLCCIHVLWIVYDIVEITSICRRSRIPCVVVEKITMHRREDGGIVVQIKYKKYKVDELSIKILAIYLQQ